jgi:UMF1 family MFS transporter
MEHSKAHKSFSLQLFSWALYDWGNSAFSAIIQTFVFAAYFATQVAENETIGTAQWGFANGISSLIVALIAPFLGAMADRGNSRKIWVVSLTYLCIIATSLLWFVKPDPSYTTLALVMVGIGIIGSELAFVFYNAALPEIAPSYALGKWSGWGWSFGYAGGVASLVLALFLFVDEPSLINSDRASATHIRSTFPLVGIWFCIFSLPFFLFVPDIPGKGISAKKSIILVIKEFRQMIVHLRVYKNITKFFIAVMVYHDGLVTLFAFGGVYAASLFGMKAKEILLFGIALNIISGIGAASFGWLDDKIGSKKLILISLIGLIFATSSLLLVTDSVIFWWLGLSLGLFVGPVQSASRSYMARTAPAHLRNEMFGFFALSGKCTAFAGPLLVGWITYLTKSERAGMSVILIFFIIGFIFMCLVPDAKHDKQEYQLK